MKSPPSKIERSAIFSELKTDYLYVLIPFFLLVCVKLYIGSWREVVLSADWSLASCMIFGQITSKLSRAIAKTSLNKNYSQFGWYTAKRFAFVIISAAFYFGMLVKPSIGLGFAQIVVFFIASFFHFSDGYAALLMDRADNQRMQR